MKNYLKILFLSIIGFLSPIANGAEYFLQAAPVANVYSNLVTTGGLLVTDLNWINTSTNAAAVTLYDSASLTTNTIVRPAYVSFTRATANITNVFTNAANIVMTNIYSATTYTATTNAAVTNTRPAFLTFLVPASGSVTLTDINREAAHGLGVLATQGGTVLVTYRNISP